MDLERIKQKAKSAKSANKKFFTKLKRNIPENLDSKVHGFHDEAFQEIDCITCANCCKTTSPIFSDKDIERLANHFHIKPSQFIEKYLHIDEDRDYVLNSAPCAFLDLENYCTVYENRPTACREYPHTNRKRFYQVFDLTLKNTEICPAVFNIVEKMKIEFQV